MRLWASQEVTEVVVVVTEAKGHGGGYRREWTWRCGAGVLLSSRDWKEKEIIGRGPRNAWTQGYSQVSGWLVGRRLHWLGCCFCTKRLQLCHDATNGCPHQRGTAGAIGAGGGAGHRRCALRPSSSRRSAILRVATQLRAWRHVDEARRGAVTCSSGVLDNQL